MVGCGAAPVLPRGTDLVARGKSQKSPPYYSFFNYIDVPAGQQRICRTEGFNQIPLILVTSGRFERPPPCAQVGRRRSTKITHFQHALCFSRMRAAYGTRGALLNSGNLASSISSTVRSELRDNREQLKVARLLDFCPQIETSTVETRGLSPAFSS